MKSPLGTIVQTTGEVESASNSANDLMHTPTSVTRKPTLTNVVDDAAICRALATPHPPLNKKRQQQQSNNNVNVGHNSTNNVNSIALSETEKRANARKAALEEAKSVLSAISLGGGESSSSSAADTHRMSSISENAMVENSMQQQSLSSPPPPPNNDLSSPDQTKQTPKSRSDAVAAAKRRAEERKRAAVAGGGGSAATGVGAKDNNTSSSQLTTTTNAATGRVDTTNDNNQMDWFNLLGVVTNPGYDSWDGTGSSTVPQSYSSSHSRTTSQHHKRGTSSRHGGLSSHGTPISLDHVGSDGTRGSGDTYAASILAAAGLPEWAGYANTTSASASATMGSVANSLDEFTGWFDHYSRKYLGTVPGIDGASSLLGEGEDYGGDGSGIVGNMGLRRSGSSTIIWEEYEPEFGPDDIPELQLEELPGEIAELDLGSVERFLRECGILGMRFEDRGGGFHAMRNKAKLKQQQLDEKDQIAIDQEEDGGKQEGKKATARTNPEVAKAIEAVPEIFFSPYFDLTDPICFENLLVVSDEEVAQIRAKEAELHALAEQKVKEAEEVARKDAENQTWAPRPPPRHAPATGGGGNDLNSLPKQLGMSMTKDAKTSSSPADGNVIALRKPETFTTHLDYIELALLDQVRSKSDSFFRETNRFSELQQLVTASVDEVRSLRTDMQSLRERCVTNVELIPIMDDSRHDLRAISRVLEAVEDVVNCKMSIASLMSAGDHLGAVEAIRLARTLLAASPDDEDENDNHTNENGIASTHQPQQHRLCLGKLKALSKVGEQLNEYEKLVVRNLTDELVETFLSWGSEKTSLEDGGTSGSVDYRAPPRVSLSLERRSNLREVVQSLRKCGHLSDAGVAYQKKLCELISVTLKAIVTECVADAATNSMSGGDTSTPAKGTMAGVASMSLDQFLNCINMLFEQVLGLLWGAVAVNKFCIQEGIILDDKARTSDSTSAENREANAAQHTPSATAAALAAAADLSEKSVSELLRLRREAHSLVSFDGMRQLWDTSLTFTLQLERFSGRKAYGLRSTLLAQAKSFVERKHEANMSTLVAALDSERWVQCTVSADRQAALTRLCSGRAAFTSRKPAAGSIDNIASPSVGGGRDKMTDAEVEGVRFKVVWSALLLLEMVMDDVACAAHFQTLATNVVGKVSELLRLFNTRATHLVLGAGAIHSAARLKSINAKHLAIVTQCIGIVLAILPHVRAALMAQLPAKQHSLLHDIDKIKTDYTEHSEKILSKLVSIIGGIVEHSLAAKIPSSNFDTRASTASTVEDDAVDCCPFIDSVMTNTKKMHQVLNVMLPPELLRDVFSRIFAYLDHKVPSLYKDAALKPTDPINPSQSRFSMPTTEEGKRQMVKEVECMTKTLNGLSGVEPWNFTAMKVLEQELDIEEEESLPVVDTFMPSPVSDDVVAQSEVDSDEKKETEDGDDQALAESRSPPEGKAQMNHDNKAEDASDVKDHQSEGELQPLEDVAAITEDLTEATQAAAPAEQIHEMTEDFPSAEDNETQPLEEEVTASETELTVVDTNVEDNAEPPAEDRHNKPASIGNDAPATKSSDEAVDLLS